MLHHTSHIRYHAAILCAAQLCSTLYRQADHSITSRLIQRLASADAPKNSASLPPNQCLTVQRHTGHCYTLRDSIPNTWVLFNTVGKAFPQYNQVKSVKFIGCPFLPLIPTSQQLRNAPSAVLKPFQYISATYTKQATTSDPQFPYSHFFCAKSQRSNLKEDKLLVAHLAKSPDTA